MNNTEINQKLTKKELENQELVLRWARMTPVERHEIIKKVKFTKNTKILQKRCIDYIKQS